MAREPTGLIKPAAFAFAFETKEGLISLGSASSSMCGGQGGSTVALAPIVDLLAAFVGRAYQIDARAFCALSWLRCACG